MSAFQQPRERPVLCRCCFRAEERAALADRLESEIRPLINERPEWERGEPDQFGRYEMVKVGGYNCCGCSTYDAILDHAIRIVRGEQ